MIKNFSPEVIKAIGYYVYELIDPRNGHVFYVGMGKGNRVFQHAKGIIKDDGFGQKNNKSGTTQEIVDDELEQKNNKSRTIQEIINEGLEVMYVIVRYGMDKSTALEVEAALIDVIPGLTNIQSGLNSDRGIINPESLQRVLSAKEYEEPEFEYMIIKITESRIDECGGNIYKAARYCWKVNLEHANNTPYIFVSVQGVIKAVYENPVWKAADVGGRYEFDAKAAEKSIRDQYIGKKIPKVYMKKGNQNPIIYKHK
ncbi:MAG: hypothetical protein Q4C64_03620 [Erysipelotrichia bacterium]|nr:hypothetical protein [Erysipelotrichia bacterium]